MLRSESSIADEVRVVRRRSLSRRLTYDNNLPDELVAALWEGNADHLLFSSAPLQVKDRCAVARHDSEIGPLLVKRHTWGGFWRTVRCVGREASARCCGRIGRLLAQHEIPTPRPRAVLEEHIGPIGRRSYLVTDFVEGTDLYQFIRYGAPSEMVLRHVARQVARIWQQLLEAGISHGDAKPENFILDNDLKVWVIDFEKTRLGGKPGRLCQRQIADVRNFLHLRGWHHRPAARQIFADAFYALPCGAELRKMVIDPAQENDVNLAVQILCRSNTDVERATRAIDSVRDIADEILLVAPDEEANTAVIRRIEPCGPVPALPQWTLVLHENESATPFLAKQLRQRIAERHGNVAFRCSIEYGVFGQTAPGPGGADAAPIRLFRPDCCPHSTAGGKLTISVDSKRTGTIPGSIEHGLSPSVAEFVERLNERTTVAARQRCRQGERPRLLRAGLCAARDFVKACFGRGGIRNGWSGLQLAAIEAGFTWLEECKLRQFSSQFADADSSTGGWGNAPGIRPGALPQPPSNSESHRRAA